MEQGGSIILGLVGRGKWERVEKTQVYGGTYLRLIKNIEVNCQELSEIHISGRTHSGHIGIV